MQKLPIKCWWKWLRTGVNFINILRAAFARADPKIAIKIDNSTVFFALSGSERVKAAHRTLIKMTTGVNFINIQFYLQLFPEWMCYLKLFVLAFCIRIFLAKKLLVKCCWNRAQNAPDVTKNTIYIVKKL